jgi:glycogen(starch) synthase
MLNRHRTVVLPNIEKEGFGIVALEGMACGCTLIVARAGGLKEAVGKFGQTFTMGDQEELVRLMRIELDGLPMLRYTQQELLDYLAAHAPSVAIRNYLSFLR